VARVRLPLTRVSVRGRRRIAPLALVAALLVAAATAGIAGGAAASPTAARTRTRPFVSGWMPYWATATSLAQVQAHPGLFTELSPFWYALKKSPQGGTTVLSHPLDSGTYASVVAALHAEHVRVVPTITDQTGTRVLAGLLAAPRTRAAVVATLTRQAVHDGVDGLDLDFEGFAFHDGRPTWAALHPHWIAFVHELHDSLARVHKVLDVTVPPIDSTGNSYWVYDPVRIAPYVHALRLMAYDYHVDVAGPISPMPWVKDVIATTLAGVPAGKVFLGVAAYGRSWVTARTGSCPAGVDLTKKVVSPVEAAALAAASKVRHSWDATVSERTFSYARTYTGSTSGASPTPVSCTVTRTVWYDDAAAITVRARAAAAAHLGGIAVWSIDDVPPATWAALTTVATGAQPAKASTTKRAATAKPAARAAAPTPTVSPTTSTTQASGAAGPSSDSASTPAAGQTVAAELPPTTFTAAEGDGWRRPVTVWGMLALALLAVGFVVLRARLSEPAPVSAGRHARPSAHAGPPAAQSSTGRPAGRHSA
jgi:spore germination protein YaaH